MKKISITSIGPTGIESRAHRAYPPESGETSIGPTGIERRQADVEKVGLGKPQSDLRVLKGALYGRNRLIRAYLNRTYGY